MSVQLYSLCNSGRADEGNDDLRWVGKLIVPKGREWAPYTWQLCKGTPVTDWVSSTQIDMDSSEPFEDMPWIDDRGHVVSDRFRILIEKAAPNHAEFLPVVLTHRGKKINAPPYWMTNWLHLVDCYDREKSIYQIVSNYKGGTRLSFDHLVVRTDSIPANILVCRVAEFQTVTVIRSELRQFFDEHGMTGCQYYPVSHT
jgi:hypothetical protein